MLLDGDLIYTKATDALAHDPPPHLISRVANILLCILNTTYEPNSICVNLFLQLLPFLDNSGVLDLYISVTQSSSPMIKFHKMLLNSLFADLFLLEVDGNCSPEKYASLCRIVRHASKNPIIGPSFRRDVFVDRLAVLSLSDNLFLRHNVWQALSTMTQDDTAPYLRSVVPLALNIITEPFQEIHSYIVCALDFLTKLLNIENKNEAEYHNRQIQGTFTRLMVDFPDSTNLQCSLFRLIRSALKWETFAKYLFPQICPVLLEIASYETHSAAKMNCLCLINDIVEGGKSFQLTVLNNNPEFSDFKKNILKPYFKLLNSSYGGRLPLM